MSHLSRTIKRGVKILREDGPIELVRRSIKYSSRLEITRSGINVSYQTGSRVDFEHRWKLLCDSIDPQGGTIVDIGCAEGNLTARFAEEGFLSIGIERQPHTVAAARSFNSDQTNLGFLQYEITPESIESLPRVDIILLLTVYHHWVREFGWEAAEQMLKTLETKCDTLLFEIPETRMDRPSLSNHEDHSIVSYYTILFETVFDKNIDVKFLGKTDYVGDDRDDLIFSIVFRNHE